MSAFDTPERALAWLVACGAHPWLVRHHELVVEAAIELADALERLGLRFDRRFVLAGAALHDAGKVRHPGEMSAPGHAHERDGEQMLAEAGAGELARVARTHAGWADADAMLEDRLVALADKLWKGKRDEALETALVDELARADASAGTSSPRSTRSPSESPPRGRIASRAPSSEAGLFS